MCIRDDVDDVVGLIPLSLVPFVVLTCDETATFYKMLKNHMLISKQTLKSRH